MQINLEATNLRGVVSLLELLRAHVNIYVYACHWLAFSIPGLSEGKLSDNSRLLLRTHLKALREECERTGLEMTVLLIDDIIPLVEHPNAANMLLHEALGNLSQTLRNELSLRLFVRIGSEHRKFYDYSVQRLGKASSRNVGRPLATLRK